MRHSLGMAPVPGGQEGGQNVVVPSGVLIRVRINRPLSSDRTPAGTTFDGIVANDVTAGGEVAIPRGAAVEGRVLSAEKSGALKGRGEMQIQLTQVTLGGKNYALVSDVWDHHGGDKTIETINKTAGLGAVGAVFGALAGGGVGAAVGGGVGAALGLGSSAASGQRPSIYPIGDNADVPHGAGHSGDHGLRTGDAKACLRCSGRRASVRSGVHIPPMVRALIRVTTRVLTASTGLPEWVAEHGYLLWTPRGGGWIA